MSRSANPSAESLLLREWALHLIGTEAGPSDPLWRAAADCDPRSWELFLRIERCALPLQVRLDRAGATAWARLPDPVARVIRDRATKELQRVLSARAQIRTVARLAEREGWQVMVLKGGVAVADGELIDLGDVDILVEPERAGEVAAALGAVGFERQGLDSAAPHHLAARVQPNALHIEIHHSLKGGDSLDAFRATALPLRGELALLGQRTTDHLRYLLLHSTLEHPERIGRIRDLLLIGHALRSATPPEIAEVEAGLQQGQVGEIAGAGLYTATPLAVLRLARSLEARGYQGDDPHRASVLRAYILFRRRWWFTQSRAGLQILNCAIRISVQGRRHWLDAYRYLHTLRMETISASPFIARLERRLPPLASATRQLLRLLTFTTATVYALITETEARSIERAAR